MKSHHFRRALLAVAALTVMAVAGPGVQRATAQTLGDGLAAPLPVFVHSPADPGLVAALVPRGNLNPQGGHVRPVKHMYMEYLSPFGGGGDVTDVFAMAVGQVVMVSQRQSAACVRPDPSTPTGCATDPDAVHMVDEYQVWIQHTGYVTSYYDHLHGLDPKLGIRDWHDSTGGWLAFGSQHILFPGINGVPSVRVSPGERVGVTRNYFGAWDIGALDTRETRAFLGSGPLRYPSVRDFISQSLAEGGPGIALGPDEPFPGEMFVNSVVFIDYMIPPLASLWRGKLAGDGSGGRPDWDVANTLQGNWHRAEVTTVSFASLLTVEDDAVSFSPYNRDPQTQTQIGLGDTFFAALSSVVPAIPPTVLSTADERLRPGLRLTPDRAVGTLHNPDPLAVPTAGYACYDVPDPFPGDGHPFDGQTHSLLVYLPVESGETHLRLRYIPATCAAVLTTIGSNPAILSSLVWWGNYVR